MCGINGDLKDKIGNLNLLNINGKEFYILGTAHVSSKSIEDVKNIIQEVNPDTVCVELCEQRFRTMTDKRKWEDMNIFKVIKENKALFLLMQLILSFFYQKVGKKLKIKPGAEMNAAIEEAQNMDVHIELIDRDVNITLKRVWRSLSFWEKLKLFYYLLSGIFSVKEITPEEVEKLKTEDQLNKALEEIGKRLPKVKRILVDERDIFLAQKIKNAPGNKIVAIVGAGHVPGILKNISQDYDLDPLLEISKPSLASKFLKWLIPLIILICIGLGFLKGGKDFTLSSLYVWIVINGSLSALGAAAALAHPVTIFSAFIAAPITSLNPAIAAGWVAGLVQAWIKKPTVKDLQELPIALSSFKGFWKNSFCKVLLVVALSNLGSAIGTFIAGSWIVGKLFK